VEKLLDYINSAKEPGPLSEKPNLKAKRDELPHS
jgi:hypothetical protein